MGSSTQSALLSVLDGFERTPIKGAHTGPDGLMVCDRCGTPRQVRLTDPDGRERLMPCMCRCMVEEQEREEREAEESKRKRVEAARVRLAFPSERMREMTFAADDGRFGRPQTAQARAYSNRFVERHGEIPYGLLMFGAPDSGKTFLSCCIANAVLDAGYSVLMRSMPQLLQTRDQDMLDLMMRVDLLVLDDLGAERNTSYGQEYVYAVVDGRYAARKPMIVSTNLTREELAAPSDVMSARIYGRVLEACLPMEVNTGRRRATAERYAAMRADLGL